MEETKINNIPESFFSRWKKRLLNFIPSSKAVKKGLSFCWNKLFNNKDKKNSPIKDLLARTWRTLNSFSGYRIKTPETTAEKCSVEEKPIIFKIESNSDKKRHFHGGAYYDGIAVDSNGRGDNKTPNGKLTKPDDMHPTYFVLYPSKLGIDANKFKMALKAESIKENDYDLYVNNCIDHVTRPLKEAGASLDFGEIATPRELCAWCDQMCVEKKGMRLNENEYKKLLTTLEAQTPKTQNNVRSNLIEKLTERKRTSEHAYNTSPKAPPKIPQKEQPALTNFYQQKNRSSAYS
jgi:hypothetical protein